MLWWGCGGSAGAASGKTEDLGRPVRPLGAPPNLRLGFTRKRLNVHSTQNKRLTRDCLPAGCGDLLQQLLVDRVLVRGVVVCNARRDAKRELIDHVERQIFDRPVGWIGGE